MMNKQIFSSKVASILNDYSALPSLGKAETLTNIRRIILTVKSRRARKVLRKLEDYFKLDLVIGSSKFSHNLNDDRKISSNSKDRDNDCPKTQ